MFSTNASQVSTAANYIEDVFSTYLYTANNQVAQTITNGIDLSGKGGLVWIKTRSAAYEHFLVDTTRGAANYLQSQSTAAQINYPTGLTSFNSNGFSIGTDSSGIINYASTTLASWAFRKQPKFFDVVTFTGNGSSTNNISHNLGSLPGFIIVKRTDSVGNWAVLAGDSSGNYIPLILQSSNATNPSLITPKSTIASTTTFNAGWIGDNWDGSVNVNGGTYVAYLFAHNAGGFGLTGTDNVISCGSGSWSGGSDNVVNLGYEAQWLMYKSTDVAGSNWIIFDIMRGMSFSASEFLRPNLSNAAVTNNSPYAAYPTATGFTIPAGSVNTGNYIYIAIRRGPMKVPTDATKVFSPAAQNAASNSTVTTGFPVDLAINANRNGGSGAYWMDRLRGGTTTSTIALWSASTDSEYTNASYGVGFANNTAIIDNFTLALAGAGPYAYWNFRRAPGFFDEVCYTGTGSNTTFTHNLGAVPELIIVKRRDTTGAWDSYSSALANTEYVVVNTTAAKATGATRWNSTTPTSSVFSVGTSTTTNASAGTYVAYLFATCAGVSKVGSYTGTGATQTISCGFTGGARFVLIKRTDTTGDWYVWDTARGMVSGTDPSLLLNSTAAEVNANSIYTTGVGFQIVSTAAGINASGGSYIFLAIA